MALQNDENFVSGHVLLRRVAVKFFDDLNLIRSDHYQLPYVDGVENSFPGDLRDFWDPLTKQHPRITLKRVYTSISPERIEQLSREAEERDPKYKAPSFLTFFAVDTPSLETAEQIAARLLEWKGVVEYAYVEPLAGLPTLSPSQKYIDAPTAFSSTTNGGVNALNVPGWTDPVNFPWASGNGIRFVDIEKGWNLDHPSLVTAGGAQKISFLPGLANNFNMARDPDRDTTRSLPFENRQHGTRVLGILAASENTGTLPNWKGIAERAGGFVVSIWWNTPGGVVQNVENAIKAASSFLSAGGKTGDVVLLELDTEVAGFGSARWPIECSASVFPAIREATALGITVVEAAGNSGYDFDDLNSSPFKVNPASDPSRYTPNPNYNQDSGAIIVGAVAMTPHGTTGRGDRASNYGSRVNCFAWEDSVYTQEIDATNGANTDTAGNPRTTVNFSGTSAASAIIAGAAIVLQSISEQPAPQGIGRRLTPAEMRTRLSDFTTGTLSANSSAANPNADRIGVMPNLSLIINKLRNP
jgi:hypothetical protein